MKLTWTDLLIDDITPDEFTRWMSPWEGLITGPIAPAFMSKFGTWFLRRPQGQVEMLDVFSGEVAKIADSYDAFIAEVNDRSWQELYLCSELIYRLHQEGIIPGSRQCYALAPHPMHGGPNPLLGDEIQTRFVMVMDIPLWQDICAQTVRGSR